MSQGSVYLQNFLALSDFACGSCSQVYMCTYSYFTFVGIYDSINKQF